MAAEKCPAFQFYPKDFLMDGNVATMSLAERGAYITLLCHCWLECSIPSEPALLARLVGVGPRPFAVLWPAIAPCFKRRDDGRLVHLRLDREREKQAEFRQSQSDRAKRPRASRNLAESQPDPSRNLAETEPKPSSPISYLQSPISNTERETLSVSQSAKPSLNDPSLDMRGGRLVERYQELYIQHLGGAKYRPRPNLDWHDACDLCRHWDDARLEKLAVLVLTTDDEWISKTDRSFRIFALKASWADGKLTAWEAKQAAKGATR